MELEMISSKEVQTKSMPLERKRVERTKYSDTQAKDITIRILSEITAQHPLENLKIRLWDGSCWPSQESKAVTLVLNRPSALKEMLIGGCEASIGEAYIDKAFDIEGDFESAFIWSEILSAQSWGFLLRLKVMYLLLQLPNKEGSRNQSIILSRASLHGRRHSVQRDQSAIRFHYDISNEFYSLWLDPQMIYSCAYFESENDNLQQAQFNKLDHICRKLNLKPGQRLLDIGCGWGGLVMHAARYYGVQADGITLSGDQAVLARNRIQEAGLRGRVRVYLKDYREMEEYESYDAIASVGMVEHVGRNKLAEYFHRAAKLLRNGGLFLNHGIALGPVKWLDTSKSFINEFVFPDGELLPIHDMLHAAETAHLEVRDVESLREHYPLTLRHWIKRLDSHRKEALRYVDEKILRIWKLYMAGSAYNFSDGHLSLYQTLFTKLSQTGKSPAPLTRRPWYTRDRNQVEQSSPWKREIV